jgi:subtilisin family serine protease
MRLPRLVAFVPRAVAIAAATGLAGVAGALGLAGLPGAQAAQAAQADNIRASQQWVLDAVNAPTAWDQSEGAGVTVAVLDSGVNGSVSDLSGSVISGPDLTGLSTPPSNPNWGVHGTWMASIIAGHGHDGGDDGIMGIAPEAKILSIRVIPEKTDPGYKAYDAEPEDRVQQALATGIRDAVKDGAQVISMSLGYTTPSAVVRSAVQYAFEHGVVLVASSGNSGKNDSSGATSSGNSPSSASSSALSATSAVSEPAAGPSASTGSVISAGSDGQGSGFAPDSFPAEYPGVLSVGALQENGTVASFSSNNLSVRVGAPGDNVPAEGRDGQYWLVSGTSPACAVTAGVAALVKSKYRTLSAAEVDQAITISAQDNPAGGYDAESGFGEADASAALREAGVLAATKSAGSQVTTSVRFGEGTSASPDAPVAPRGIGSLILFSTLAAVSLVVAAGAGLRVRAVRRAAMSAGAGPGTGGLSGTGGLNGGGASAGYYGSAGASTGGYGPAPAYPSSYQQQAPAYQQQAPAGPPPGYTQPAGYPQPGGWPESPAYPRAGVYGQPGAYPGQADDQSRSGDRYGSGGQYRAGHRDGDDFNGTS